MAVSGSNYGWLGLGRGGEGRKVGNTRAAERAFREFWHRAHARSADTCQNGLKPEMTLAFGPPREECHELPDQVAQNQKGKKNIPLSIKERILDFSAAHPVLH